MNDQIELEEGWAVIQDGITRMISDLESVVPDEDVEEGWEIIQNEFTKKIPDESYMKLYSTIYSMCTQEPPADKELYERYQGVYDNYLQLKVLPVIQEKHDDVSMLHEVVKRWENHKVLVKKLSRCFFYLESFYIPQRKLPTLEGVGFNCFRKIIGEGMMKVLVKDAVNRLINREREGEEIDQTLLKNVLQIFYELGNTQNIEDNSPPTTSQPKAPQPPRAKASVPKSTYVPPMSRDYPLYNPTSSTYVPPMFRNSPACIPTLSGYIPTSPSYKPKPSIYDTSIFE